MLIMDNHICHVSTQTINYCRAIFQYPQDPDSGYLGLDAKFQTMITRAHILESLLRLLDILRLLLNYFYNHSRQRIS